MPVSDEWNVRGVTTPGILKKGDGGFRWLAAFLGLAAGAGASWFCFQYAQPESNVGRMFDFHQPQIVVPISILWVFFWGLLLCLYRWRRVAASERVASTELALAAATKLKEEGIEHLSVRLEQPTVQFNPLLRRLKAVVDQWQLKPGLVEADLVLQQFAADDEEATRRAHGLVRTFVWALPVLGLIGTVLGIAFAVGGFASFLGGHVDDVDAIKTSLVGVTGGLSFAFLLTLLGLATSLVLMLLTSSVEAREEQLNQAVQQRVAGVFLPSLQRLYPVSRADESPIIEPIKTAAETLLAHLYELTNKTLSELSVSFKAQQGQVASWGQSLRDQTSSAAAVLARSLESATKSMHESEEQFLTRLDSIRQLWKEQTEAMGATLQKQSETSRILANELQTSLAKSLGEVHQRSESVAQVMTALTESTRKTAEAQASVQTAVRQLADMKLVETLDSFRMALTRHADLVDKLNNGITIRVNN
jgi:biopolymer transport protein ExbB/TolQ